MNADDSNTPLIRKIPFHNLPEEQLMPVSKRILVLDDNEDILEVVTEVLTYEDFDVHATTNSIGILDRVSEYDPHLVILDYRLSNANGGEICKQIKTDPKYNNIPVIIFSAYINLSVDYSAYGCDAVISKPFDLNQLIETVNGLMEK